MNINWGKVALAGGAIGLFVMLARSGKPKEAEKTIAPGEPTPTGTSGLGNVKKKRKKKHSKKSK